MIFRARGYWLWQAIVMARPLISEELWNLIAPHLPPERPKQRGRRPLSNRQALTGILFVLKTGIPWEDLPREMGCGCGMTCWRRLRDWQQAGVWDRILEALQNELGRKGRIDWSRASLDSASVRAVGAGARTGPNPTDRGKPGSKHHLIVDRHGIPLSAPLLTPANEHDSLELGPALDAIKPIRKPRGRPRRRPKKLHADKAYDHRICRTMCRVRGVQARIARRGIESSSRLGRYRWVVERTLAWLHRMRRLAVRYDRRADIHQGFLTLGTILIASNFL